MKLTNEVDQVQCQGCDKQSDHMRPITYHRWARQDAYGIYTGLYCDDCYESDRYPYRRDRYPTVEYDGYGETLGQDSLEHGLVRFQSYPQRATLLVN